MNSLILLKCIFSSVIDWFNSDDEWEKSEFDWMDSNY